MDIIHNAIGYYYTIDGWETLVGPFETVEEAIEAAKASRLN